MDSGFLQELSSQGIEKRQFGHGFVYRYPESGKMPFLSVESLVQDIGKTVSKKLCFYFHIPFCVSLCSFCHYFKKKPENKEEIGLCLRSLEKEIENYALLFEERPRAEAILFGGGTPSMLQPKQLQHSLNVFSQAFGLARKAEATIEASPETISEEKAGILRQSFNRISIGIQTLDNALLKRFYRKHSAEQAIRAVEDARKAGFENINIDLLYGLPGQTIEGWRKTLESVLEMQPESLTASDLRVLPQSEMYNSEESFPGQEEMLAMYSFFAERMLEEGYVQQFPYQFVRKGREMRFLENQWSNREFIGFGPSSCSYLAGWDYNNWFPLQEYEGAVEGNGIGAAVGKRLSEKERMIRKIALGLKKSGLNRKKPGIDKKEFKKTFGRDIGEVFPSQLEKLFGQNLLEERQGHLSLSEKGLFFHDEVARRFFAKQ